MVSAAECMPSAAMALGAPTTRAVPLQQPSRRAAVVEASATDRSSSAASVLRMLVERFYPPQCVETAEISAIMAVASSAVRVVLAVLGVRRRRFLFQAPRCGPGSSTREEAGKIFSAIFFAEQVPEAVAELLKYACHVQEKR